MGHASITTTANIYTHIGDEDLRKAAIALENYRNATQPPTYPKVSDDDIKEAAYKLENYRGVVQAEVQSNESVRI